MNLRRLGIGVVAVAVFATGLWSGIGSAGWLSTDAEPIALTATLNVGKEVPRPKGVSAKAQGSFAAGLTRKGTGGTLSWRITFHGLTGKAVAAHVHLAKPGKAGPVVVPLCGPCRSGSRGSAKVKARTVAALLGGGAYVNVHTAKNPTGEIRGQVTKGGKAPLPPTTTTTTDTTTTTTTYDPYP
ncbi:MAG TPA: CHRD domain-containing protein [Gaiellaceae bacterium]|nr:CHRD domain-containing protein [Gaiellaceae bacterium]